MIKAAQSKRVVRFFYVNCPKIFQTLPKLFPALLKNLLFAKRERKPQIGVEIICVLAQEHIVCTYK